MPSVARSLAVVLAGALLVSTVATAERYLVTEPLGGTAEDAIKLAGSGDLAPTPSASPSADGVLKIEKTGVYLGTVRGEVTLAGPDDAPAGAKVTFTLYGAKQQAWTDAGAPFSVSVDTRTLPNGEYRLAVETRWPGGMSTRVATLLIDNAAGPAPSAKPTPFTPSGTTPTTTPSKPPAATTTTTTKARRTTTTTKRTTKAASGSSSSNASFTDEVVRLTNVERASNGCGALAIDATLTKVAQAHSEDMAAKNYFDHTSLDGRSPFQRMTDAGYRYSTAAENIAAGYATPAAVVDGWMNSSGHRANILNCSLKQIGVGYATSTTAQYRTYWTQDFGTPR